MEISFINGKWGLGEKNIFETLFIIFFILFIHCFFSLKIINKISVFFWYFFVRKIKIKIGFFIDLFKNIKKN